MTERVLKGAFHDGLVRLTEAPPMGMLLLKAPRDQVLADVLRAAGLGLPGTRRIEHFPAGQVGWMAPDELLLLVLPAALPLMERSLAAALRDHPHILADISGARVLLRLEGLRAAEVLAKLVPADLLDGEFPAEELRRTHLGQAPVCFWLEEGGATLLCGRSLAFHVFDRLCLAARPGSAIG